MRWRTIYNTLSNAYRAESLSTVLCSKIDGSSYGRYGMIVALSHCLVLGVKVHETIRMEEAPIKSASGGGGGVFV